MERLRCETNFGKRNINHSRTFHFYENQFFETKIYVITQEKEKKLRYTNFFFVYKTVTLSASIC